MSEKLLIVEDDKKLNDGIRLALKNDAYFFYQCRTLQEAREILKKEDITLVLLDVNLPDGNGIDFVREIRKNSRVPIILLIEEYTYDDSVVDGVNVPPRVYRIITDITAHGGTIEKGTKITETSKRTGKSEIIDAGTSVEYGASELDRSVVNKKQIKEVLMA